MSGARFDWDPAKDRVNRLKHGVDFATAQRAFLDRRRVIAVDPAHSSNEPRYFCFGLVASDVLTVSFTYRAGVVRIFGACYWRRGRQIYDRENQVHR